MTIILGGVALAACSKRDSLYIEPGKDDRPMKHTRAPTKPPVPKP